MCCRYMADEARSLKAYGELPDNSASPLLSSQARCCICQAYYFLDTTMCLAWYQSWLRLRLLA